MGRTELVRWPFLVAPVGLLGGWLLLQVIDGDTVPGWWWAGAHALWLAGFVAFAAVGAQVWRLARPGLFAALLSAVVALSAALNVVQDGVDLVLGARAGSPDELSASLDAVAGLPGVAPVLYDVGPNLLYFALALLALLLARRGVVGRWVAVAAVLGVVAMAAALLVLGRGDPVAGVGMALLGIGVIGIGLTGSPTPVSASVAGTPRRAWPDHGR